jgi:hypothetical protein
MQGATKSYRIIPILILCGALIFCGCEGSEPREQVDDTVKELSGQKKVEQMDKMKKDLDAIDKKQADRLKQLDESADE